MDRRDLLAAILLTGLGMVLAAGNADSALDLAIGVLTIPAVTLPLAWRRRAPLAVATGVAAGMAVSALPDLEQVRCTVAVPAAMTAAYTLASRCRALRTAAGVVPLLAGLAVVGLTDPIVSRDAASFMLTAAGLVLVAAGGGRAVLVRRRLGAELARRSLELERRREETAQLAVDVERSRLADALDVAARSRLREIVTMTGAGIDGASFGAVEQTARAALAEMRSLLGLLHVDVARDGSAPCSLDRLDDLVARSRADGMAVELHMEAPRRPLPEALELAAYRIVEHALSAGAGSIAFTFTDGGLELRASGLGATGARVEEAVAAIRARVSSHGGEIDIARSDTGDRGLRAYLPVPCA